MKLNIKAFRYLSSEDWRVLQAVETGTKSHEVVPTSIIISLSGLRTGANTVNKAISALAKANLIAKEKNMKYDGYRLTYGGLDYLAMHAHSRSNAIIHLGSQMGIGKESDIYLVTTPRPSTPSTSTSAPLTPEQAILKLHRLGRTSFRQLRTLRSYHGSRTQKLSWQYLSRLSAQKEYAAMQALHAAGLPVPRPVNWNRHAVVMSLVPGTPLRAVPLGAFGPADTAAQRAQRDARIAALYAELMELALKLADVGVIHGDFNEFNILIQHVPEAAEEGMDNRASEFPERVMTPWVIDFPQITSLDHPNAPQYFDRDVQCIKDFFEKRYHYVADDGGPTFEEARRRLATATETRGAARRIDVQIEAAGFSRKMAKELGGYYDEASKEEEGEEPEVFLPPEDDEDKEQSNPEAGGHNGGDENGFQSLIIHNDQEVTLPSQEEPENRQSGGEFDDKDFSQTEELATITGLQSLSLSSKPKPMHKPSKPKTAAGWAI
ncbi:hypothetical protein FH972_009489 [Carpinus fangiana]|uniref:Serine/threonine-protein kinase RIO2 n=1 Tax=Carpinus fangiana TaxID=176857 RepID=A0A660KSC0_9ROSI|nr:hypothetical protein FH972_009489 [Carpinus fangiana]